MNLPFTAVPMTHQYNEHEQILITFHRPVINCGFCDKCKSIDIDPLPESNIFNHGVCLHFALHFNVEDLERSASCHIREDKTFFMDKALKNNIQRRSTKKVKIYLPIKTVRLATWKLEWLQCSQSRAANNFPAGAGQIVRSNLFLLGIIPFLAGQTSITSYRYKSTPSPLHTRDWYTSVRPANLRWRLGEWQSHDSRKFWSGS